MDEWVRFYFRMGLDYSEILACLAQRHRYVISMRHLKRILRKMYLFRRKHFTPLDDVASFIRQEIQGSGQLHGYRWMHLKCRQAGLVVQKEYVRILMQLLDPNGVKIRRKSALRRRLYSGRGPNYIWHLDSYDKLKPFGICINACIDGFSRNIMWLKAGSTSSDPRVIAGYFLKTIFEMQVLPMIVRGDMGTENGLVAETQLYMRRHDNDVHARNGSSFLYGTSQHNQRIESWWGVFRKENSQFWMTLFKDLKEDGLFSGDFLHKSLIRFCFLPLIQKELIDIQAIWNAHKIRRNVQENVLSGRPYMMFNMPEMYGTFNHSRPVNILDIDTCLEQCKFLDLPCDKNIYDLANMYMEENRLGKPRDAYECVTLYRYLLERFETDLSGD